MLHLILGLVPRWRHYYWSVIKGFGFILLLLVSYIVTTLYFWSHDEQIAKSYVATIVPRLEDYYQTKGDYPHSLSELTGLARAPEGLTYSNEQGGTYQFQYFEIHYYKSYGSRGAGDWYDDD